MELTINPLSAALGAEVLGVDLRGDIDEETLRRIRQAWLDHQVIVFRDQSLSADEQKRFAELLGPLQGVRTRRDDPEKPQDFMYVANRSVDGMQGVLPDGEMQFHVDQCYYENPSRATMLFAIELPSRGGKTLFSSCYKAYESLDDETKARITGLSALHVYDYDANATVRAKESATDAPSHVHPLVVRHPETGRPVLFANRLMTVRIVGLEPADSDALLETLFQAGENPAFVYEHEWRPGDLTLWDNMCTMHARTDFDPAERRVLRRVTVAGSRPQPAFDRAA